MAGQHNKSKKPATKIRRELAFAHQLKRCIPNEQSQVVRKATNNEGVAPETGPLL
jgi:hypothetical protein